MKTIVFSNLCQILCAICVLGFVDAHAQEGRRFALPIDCSLEQDCWVVNYVDVNAAEDAHQDFMCGHKTYEGHKGTDFAIRSRVEMAVGVNVLAGASGKVLRVRDGENDAMKSEEQYEAIRAANKDCGNGLLIDHGQGLQSFYCHLKNGSIIVKPGDVVEEGQVLGQVGQSGYSEFPHLHFALIHKGAHIDPFTGVSLEQGCGKFEGSLWKDELKYSPYAVFDGGFAEDVPDFETIKRGAVHKQIFQSGAQDKLIYWSGFYHAELGDEVRLEIIAPDGALFVQRDIVIEKARKRQNFYYVGRMLKGADLEKGAYVGRAIYKRKGFEPRVYTHEMIVQ